MEKTAFKRFDMCELIDRSASINTPRFFDRASKGHMPIIRPLQLIKNILGIDKNSFSFVIVSFQLVHKYLLNYFSNKYINFKN